MLAKLSQPMSQLNVTDLVIDQLSSSVNAADSFQQRCCNVNASHHGLVADARPSRETASPRHLWLPQTCKEYTAMSSHHPPPNDVTWTLDRIRALGAVTDIATTGQIFGLSRSGAYEMAQAGTLPVPVIKVGSRYRVSVAAIIAVLTAPDPTRPPPAT
ncbi:helix-turn-helix domain-containing protein [Micromonospora sp. NPDC048830]|uniref:helix-turn-helix domain-containing protein n=1 Tax=Micromonospora sp. NPDC048830 TaxID=3364257 RepID=UPI0037158660